MLSLPHQFILVMDFNAVYVFVSVQAHCKFLCFIVFFVNFLCSFYKFFVVVFVVVVDLRFTVSAKSFYIYFGSWFAFMTTANPHLDISIECIRRLLSCNGYGQQRKHNENDNNETRKLLSHNKKHLFQQLRDIKFQPSLDYSIFRWITVFCFLLTLQTLIHTDDAHGGKKEELQ